MRMMCNVFRLLRPQQWIKNLFVFAPLFFNGSIDNVALLLQAGIAFIAFCFVASAIYCVNDICDYKADKIHPIKCKRPIAAGKISVWAASAIALGCLACGITIVLCLNHYQTPLLLTCLLGYTLMNIAYSLWLKHLPLVDVFIIATGFVLRIWAGGIATDVPLSHWLVIMTFLLALFLAMAKRRDDVVLYQETGEKARKSIDKYNLDFMNQAITILATMNIIVYLLYTLSPDILQRDGGQYLYITIFFVMLGILRYLQITIVDVRSGSPTKVLLHDRFIQLCVLAWIATYVWILYF